MDPGHKHASQPAWFTPTRLLIIFCAVNLMVYLDRGAIASNGINGSKKMGTGIAGDFRLSDFQDGLLPAAFMVGLLIAAPSFAEATKHANAFRLIGLGMGVWTLAVLGCAVSYSFWPLLICRMLVGVGEASFVALAAPFIDDHAPPASKTLWFSAFYLCIPVGVAFGYIYGGIMSTSSWRLAFALEGLVMVPFVAFCFVSKPLHMHADKAHPQELHGRAGPKRVGSELMRDVRDVMSHRLFNLEVLGYTLYCAVLGVYSYWGPRAGAELFGVTPQAADSNFGLLTVFTGVIGTVMGGLLLDKMGSTIRNAFLVCAVSTLCSWVVVTVVFVTARTFDQFLAGFAVGELFLFLLQAPMAAVVMWVVPPGLRPLAISLNTMFIHVFGDVPSPPLVGLLFDRLSKGLDPAGANAQWRPCLIILTTLLLPSALALFCAAYYADLSPDYRKLPPTEILTEGGEVDENEPVAADQDWSSDEEQIANAPLLVQHTESE